MVVVCIDGGNPAYIEHGTTAGIIPSIERGKRDGFYTVAHGTMPSFTCPNNMSIVTGRPASVHGISGNFYLDRATNEPVVMTGPELVKVNSAVSERLRVQRHRRLTRAAASHRVAPGRLDGTPSRIRGIRLQRRDS